MIHEGTHRITQRTGKAVRIEDLESNKQTWLPTSLIKISFNNQGELVLDVPNWLADQSGFFNEGWDELGGSTIEEYEEETMYL